MSKYKDKKWMKEQIVEKDRTQKEIAKELDVDQTTISRWAIKLGFRQNSYYEENKNKKYRDESWLREQLKRKRRTFKDIGNQQNVSRKTIEKWAKKFGIKKYDAQTIVDGKKRCSKCNTWKELSAFRERERRSTGLCSWCRECEKDSNSKWQKQNREQRNKYFKNKRENDYCFRVNRNMGRAISRAVSEKMQISWLGYVNYSLEDLMQRLECQFYNGMSWDNYGNWHIDHKKPKTMFNFESPNEQAFRDCWSLANLQPLWASENMSKQDNFQADTKIKTT